MPLPVIPDHFYVQAIFGRTDGDDVVNTFCFRNHRDIAGESHDDPALLESMRDLLDSFYATPGTTANGLARVLSWRLQSLRYVIYDLGQPDAGSSEISSATFQSEGSTSSVAPPDVAIVITWRTALRGRSYRGRTYVGPLQSGVMKNDGRPSDNAIADIAAAAPLLIGSELTRDWQICVLSRTIPTATPVTRADVDHEFDTQRRRGHTGVPRTLISAP